MFCTFYIRILSWLFVVVVVVTASAGALLLLLYVVVYEEEHTYVCYFISLNEISVCVSFHFFQASFNFHCSIRLFV